MSFHIDIEQHGNMLIANISSDGIALSSVQDALDIIANCGYQGALHIVMPQAVIHSDFFDLKTGLAGDVLQKFSNYQSYLAIIGDFSIYNSNSLRDFIRESNKVGRINFVNSEEEAVRVLMGR